jgi:capsular exopolysaccharide synthesis family protein
LRELREQATAADRAVVEFKAQHNIVNTGGRDKPLMHEQRVAELNSQLVLARAQVAEARARVDRVEAILRAGDTSDAMVDPTVADSLKNEVITKMRMQYFTLAQRAEEWAKRYGSAHLAVVNLRGQMREIRSSIVDELRRIAETYRSDSAIAEQRQAEIEHDLEQAVGQSQVADRAQVQLTELESNAQSYRALYDDFLQRYTESVQAQSFPITEARIVTAAARPLTKSHPRIFLVMLISASGGLILGLLLGHLRDLADRVFRTRDQLEQILQFDCLATLPKIKASYPNTAFVAARGIPSRVQQDRPAITKLGTSTLVREPASTAADVVSAMPSLPSTVENGEPGAPRQETAAVASINAAAALGIDPSDVPAFDGPAAAEISLPVASFELGTGETPLSCPASDDRGAAGGGLVSPDSTDAASAPRLIARCRDPSWEVLNQPLSAYTEGIRSLKMALDLTRRRTARKNRKPKKIFGITSSSPNEGKSTIAASLAHLIAHAGHRVILVDCDLRATKLTRTFAPEAKIGLLEILSGDASLEDVVWSDGSGKLHFLPAVSITRVSHTPEIIGAEEMRTLLERFRADYEYAIIDLTPLLPVIDVRATEGLIDNYLFVVEWGRTKIDLVQRSLKEAPGISSKMLGAILNKVDSRELRRYEGYGGYDYDKYYRR